MLVVLVAVVMMMGSSEASCPLACQCSTDFLKVQCIDADLEVSTTLYGIFGG